MTKKENIEMKKEVEKLRTEVSELKQVQVSQATAMKAVKEEKRKVEHALLDLLRGNQANLGKIRKIKEICEQGLDQL